MCDLQLRKVITFLSESVLGVLGLYGRPIESIFHLYAYEGHGYWRWSERGSWASKVGCLGRTA